MIIPLINFKRYRLFINVEPRYTTKKNFIPIGCDCHPAYILKQLNIRTKSLPFDWLNINPVSGIKYITENIKTNFNKYIDDLTVNERGYIVASAFPESEFMHEKDLMENPETKAKLRRRYERFLKIFKEQECNFIYNCPSTFLTTEEEIIQFQESIFDFIKLLKKDDELLIYIRFDENYEENKINMERLEEFLRKIKKIKIAKFLREKKTYGIWGDERKYPVFLKKLDKSFRKVFPKIYFS
jgi:hypothetical protein